MLSHKLIIRGQLIICTLIILLIVRTEDWGINNQKLSYFDNNKMMKTLCLLKDRHCLRRDYTENSTNGALQIAYNNCNNFNKTIIIGYMLAKLLRQNYSQEKGEQQEINFRQYIQIKKNIFIILLLLFILSLVSFSITLLGWIQRNRLLSKGFHKLFIYWEKTGEKILPKINYSQKQQKELNLEQKYKQIFQQLVETIESKQLFLDPKLSQQDIIKYLGTNRNYLYHALKLYTNANFKGFINQFRIEHAKKHIANKFASDEKYDLADIFSECGFSTNESFYRTFKTLTGTTPGKYAKSYSKKLVKKENDNDLKERKSFLRKEKEEEFLEYKLTTRS